MIDPQKHHPRIDFPTRYLSFGEILKTNCTTAPALPAPHITWFINGKKMDELVAHSHKFRVPMSERNGRRGLQRVLEQESYLSTDPSILTLTHVSHVATRPPGCMLKEAFYQAESLSDLEETNMVQGVSRHRSRRPNRGRELYVTISELQLVATGRLEVTCVSTIPEFRSIDDKFADVRNDTVIVDVIRPSVHAEPSTNDTIQGPSTSKGSIALIPLILEFIIIILHIV
ncbi:jg7957 [Pararge aegeria aegeria]|uniref:Jg7957 protein n=1 Tax=Pararge aegeria aegeria TaxID=348720 RepID=A0A8S4SL46_9NEOP|nr:jg7957 [Pararge aegeria aegeria]